MTPKRSVQYGSMYREVYRLPYNMSSFNDRRLSGQHIMKADNDLTSFQPSIIEASANVYHSIQWSVFVWSFRLGDHKYLRLAKARCAFFRCGLKEFSRTEQNFPTRVTVIVDFPSSSVVS